MKSKFRKKGSERKLKFNSNHFELYLNQRSRKTFYVINFCLFFYRGSLKQLSSSTPIMTAQQNSPEPPSPKTLAKEEKPTTSKAREKKFHRHFPTVEVEEKVLNC